MTIDNYIQELLNSGMDLDSIGRELSCALNRKQKEIDEQEKAERLLEKHREGLIDNIFAATDTNHFDFKTAASASALAMMDAGYINSVEEAEAFFTNIMRSFEQPTHQCTCKSEGKECSCNKREKEEDGKRIITKYCNPKDVEVLRGFLRQLGL